MHSLFSIRLAQALGLASVAALASLPVPAFAELSNDSMAGLGLRSRPAYDGSASQKLEAVPVIRYLGQTFFVRSTQGVLEAGARTQLAPGLHAGAQIAYEPGRQSGDDDFLESRRVATIGRGASLGLHLEWDNTLGPVPISLLARVRKHSDSALGTQADLRASVGVLRSGPISAGLFAQAIWADTKATQAQYGITSQQSTATGLSVFQPESGWLNTSFGVLGSVDLGPKWIVVGSQEQRRLRGDASRSPLAQRSSNHYVSAGLAYRF